MKIGVALFNIVPGETGGLVPLLQGILESLFANWPEHEVVLFCTPANRRLFASVPPHVNVCELPIAHYFAVLDAYAAFLKLDVLLCSYPTCDEHLNFPACRQVVLIPDTQHEFYPEFFTAETLQNRRRAFAKVLREAGAIATISEHARQTLRDHPENRCEDIFLMPPALRHEEFTDQKSLTAEEQALLPARDFFIFPANLWPHKNHRRLLEAFALFLNRTQRPFELVLTGHPEGWEEFRKDFTGLPVRHLGFVRRGMLQMLLARARALVFFSLFEGFGMPLLEAFHAGIPVLCSNTTSLPEVGRDAVLSCDPLDVAAISSLMERIVEDEELRRRLITRGKDRLTAYSWRASSAELVKACNRLVERNTALVLNPLSALTPLLHRIEEIDADRAERLKVILHLESTNQRLENEGIRVLLKRIARRVLDMVRPNSRTAPGPGVAA